MISPMRRADRDGLLRRCHLISAWCELRQDFRSFPVDRILSSQLLDEHFSPEQGGLTAAWHALSKKAPGGRALARRSQKGPGCGKTCTSRVSAERFSLLASSDSRRQHFCFLID